MIGKLVSHYEIIEKLGEGGMGVVYRARDTKLQRTVALKFLPPEMTRDPEAKARFIHEAQAASALQHHNICTIHDVDETEDGQMFIVMDYYQGETLKDRLTVGAIRRVASTRVALTIAECIDIAIQIAAGLQEAHSKNIVHRDIKPANIMITNKGEVKVMDFGVAKLKGRTILTRESSTLGTVTYMSPEQARGEAVDHRSDIWSLGVVLYEMITGQLPFKSEYEQAIIYSILNEHPRSIKTIRPEVPIELEKVVETCLQKDPSARFQSMTEILTELKKLKKDSGIPEIARNSRIRRWHEKYKIIWLVLSGAILAAGIAVFSWYFLLAPGMKHPTIPIKRLVVLPFENLGPAEDEYFANGMMEELIVRLSSLRGLGVISRTSAVQYAKTNKSMEQIGKELKVDYALEGAVRWTTTQDGSNRVRINPNLIRISDKTTIWAETYDRVIDDIFAVQSEISQKVVEKLGITLLEPERRAVEIPPTENLGAYQAYLRARYYEGRPHFTDENWLRVVEGYQQAVELDPGFGLAFAELARAHARLYYLWYDHSSRRLELARHAAEQAMELSPELPAVHLALGYYQLYTYRDPVKALEEISIAEQGMPHSAEIFEAKTAVAMLQGHWEEAMEGSKKAFELSPRDPSIAVDLAEFYWILRKYDDAVKTCNIAVELAPDDAWPYLIKTFALWSWKGAYQETRTVLEAVPKEHAWAPWSWYWQEMYERRYREAIEYLSSLPEEWIKTKCWAMPKSLLIAYAYKLLGEQEKSRQSYTAARSVLEREVRQWPDDPRYHSSLGIAYAHLGLKEKAIAEGKKAVEILPVSSDATYGIPYVEDLAFIYTTVGEIDDALNTLDYVLSIPSWISVAWLKMDPQWDALRNQPGFLKLLEKYSGKEQ